MNEPEPGSAPTPGSNESGPVVAEEHPANLSPLAKTAVVAVGMLAVAWFLVSLVVLHSPVRDAVSEAFGGVMFILLLVSIAGALTGMARR